VASDEPYVSKTEQAGTEPVAMDGAELEVARSRSIAERALLVPLGAALVAGDELRGLVAALSSAEKADAQLRQFEERAVAARTQIELQLRRRRSQVSEWDARIGRMREQVRDTMHDLASKRGDVA
jgi:hypothetical protein